MSDALDPAAPAGPQRQSPRDVTAHAVADALLRLQRSRTRLHSAMMPAQRRAHQPADGGLASRLLSWLTSGNIGQAVEPLWSSARQLLARWWSRHPWHTPTVLLTDALQDEVTPVVRRYPVASVAIAAALGAGVVLSGAVRGRTLRRSAASAGRLARRWCIGQLSSPAVQTLVVGAITTLLASRASQASQGHGKDTGAVSDSERPADGV